MHSFFPLVLRPLFFCVLGNVYIIVSRFANIRTIRAFLFLFSRVISAMSDMEPHFPLAATGSVVGNLNRTPAPPIEFPVERLHLGASKIQNWTFIIFDTARRLFQVSAIYHKVKRASLAG